MRDVRDGDGGYAGESGAMRIALLRGRVLVRPLRETRSRGGIIIPDTYEDDPRRRDNQSSVGHGVVVAMGPPARASRVCGACRGSAGDRYTPSRCGVCVRGRVPTGVEIDPCVRVGDEVLYVGQHHSRDIVVDGEQLHAIAQEEIVAVVEHGHDAHGAQC